MSRSAKKVAIVTGGAGPGIGHGISEALASDGWNLVITDRNLQRGEAFANWLENDGKSVVVVNVDVTESNAAALTVDAALSRFGRIDGLINNVGIGLVKLAGDVSDVEFHSLFDVDFVASFRFVREALPELIKTQGAVVNIGSVHARLATPKYALYAATKAALDAFTRGLAADYGTKRVRANIIHPGLVASPQNELLLKDKVGDVTRWMDDFCNKRQCIPNSITARDVGELVKFLLGDNARSITGQSIYIDAGTTNLLWDNSEST